MGTKIRELFDGYPGKDTHPSLREIAGSQAVVEHPDPEGDAFTARLPGDDHHPYADSNPYLSVFPSKLRRALQSNPGPEDERLIRRALAVWEKLEGAKIR